jgi:hypothetical protein
MSATPLLGAQRATNIERALLLAHKFIGGAIKNNTHLHFIATLHISAEANIQNFLNKLTSADFP